MNVGLRPRLKARPSLIDLLLHSGQGLRYESPAPAQRTRPLSVLADGADEYGSDSASDSERDSDHSSADAAAPLEARGPPEQPRQGQQAAPKRQREPLLASVPHKLPLQRQQQELAALEAASNQPLPISPESPRFPPPSSSCPSSSSSSTPNSQSPGRQTEAVSPAVAKEDARPEPTAPYKMPSVSSLLVTWARSRGRLPRIRKLASITHNPHQDHSADSLYLYTRLRSSTLVYTRLEGHVRRNS